MIDKFKEYEIFVDARENSNYYKGEILPFVNKLCRKNMTSGDIDGFLWDYKKKIYIVIEQKHIREKHSQSQDLHLQFINAILKSAAETDRFCDWTFYVFKIVGNPPFNESVIHNIDTSESKKINRKQLIDILEMKIKYEDI